MYYGWSKEFLEAGKGGLPGDTARAATSDEVKDLRREAQALKEVVADLTLENRLLKKSMIGDGGEERMRYSPSDKTEIIRLKSSNHICRLGERWKSSGIPRSSFYRWVLIAISAADRKHFAEVDPHRPDRVWNRIPEAIRSQMVDLALDQPELSPRELAVRFTDEEKYFVSEASVYRLLKAHDLIASPAYIVIKAAEEFKDKTTAPNQLWQTDFTYLKIGLGLVLSLHRAGRLLALHCRLEALCDHEGEGRHRHPRSGVGDLRSRSNDRCSPTAPAVG